MNKAKQKEGLTYNELGEGLGENDLDAASGGYVHVSAFSVHVHWDRCVGIHVAWLYLVRKRITLDEDKKINNQTHA